MIPKEEIYIPPMNINVLDHRHFGRKPIVGVHVIKSLSRFRVDRSKEAFLFSSIEGNLSEDLRAFLYLFLSYIIGYFRFYLL